MSADGFVPAATLEKITDTLSWGAEHYGMNQYDLAHDKLDLACDLAGHGLAGKRLVVMVLLMFLKDGTPPVHQRMSGGANITKLVEMLAEKPGSRPLPPPGALTAAQNVVDASVVAPDHVLRQRIAELDPVIDGVLDWLYRAMVMVTLWSMFTANGNPM